MNIPTPTGRLTARLMNNDGTTAAVCESTNMITDNALNLLCTGDNWDSIFTDCHIGSGNSADSVGSGSITATAAAGTVTASSSFFNSGMVGRTVYFDSGEWGIIVTYSSPTTVVLSRPVTVAVGTHFGVWQTNRTDLDSRVQSSNNRSVSINRAGSTLNIVTVHTFASPSVNINVSEVGYNKGNSPSIGVALSHLNSRVVLPTPFSIQTTQYLVLTYTVSIDYSSILNVDSPFSVSITNVGTVSGKIRFTGYSGDGDNLRPLWYGLHTLSTTGPAYWNSSTTEYVAGQGYFGFNAPAPQKSVTAYVQNSFEVFSEWYWSAPSDTLNGIRTIQFATTKNGSIDNYTYGYIRFDSGVSKSLDEELRLSLKMSYRRSFTNPA